MIPAARFAPPSSWSLRRRNLVSAETWAEREIEDGWMWGRTEAEARNRRQVGGEVEGGHCHGRPLLLTAVLSYPLRCRRLVPMKETEKWKLTGKRREKSGNYREKWKTNGKTGTLEELKKNIFSREVS